MQGETLRWLDTVTTGCGGPPPIIAFCDCRPLSRCDRPERVLEVSSISAFGTVVSFSSSDDDGSSILECVIGPRIALKHRCHIGVFWQEGESAHQLATSGTITYLHVD